jgi:hypothetical protein
MGRESPGAFNHLAKLERGELKQPSVGLLLDYLRACGARPPDVAALFGPYLSLPPVQRTRGDAAVKKLLEVLPEKEQRQILAWDKGTTKAYQRLVANEPQKKRPRVETGQQRVFRIVWSFVHANWSEVFEQKLYETMLKLKDEVPKSDRRFAEDLDGMDQVKLYVKLPKWFKVQTPVGEYNPDWAIVWEPRDSTGEPTAERRLYLVRETKDPGWPSNARQEEVRKVKCGTAHFKHALDVNYRVVSSANELPRNCCPWNSLRDMIGAPQRAGGVISASREPLSVNRRP